ncbi:MAG: T9SS type A sorting domain-containing protein [Bacteroidetes bacterium]|nr:T9SS type A sorting domain-containing protein [Bacteroidota bacterium]
MGSVPASYTYSQVSAYTVTQIVSNPIGSDTAVREINNLGTIETSEGQVLVFPNPASEVLHFMLPPTHQVERIVLLTTDGRVIHTVIPSRSTQVQMSVGSLANGTYLLEFVGNERYSMPVIIRH